MNRSWALTIALLLGLAGAAGQTQAQTEPGTSFKDCEQCPDMVVVPAGTFAMGAPGQARTEPVHSVTFAKPFAVGKFTVTFDEWDACVADGGCEGYRPNDGRWGRGRRPVINVNWRDAQNYVEWLKKKTGKPYRLLSEAEFEYVARAGTTTVFWWGNQPGKGNANCEDCGSQWDNKQTAPVGSFKPNAFGLYDTSGNVTQWVADRWNATYAGAPSDGSAWETGHRDLRVMRNGSWANGSFRHHSAHRNGDNPMIRNTKIGFRVARAL